MKYKALLIDFDNTIIGTEEANFVLFKHTIEGLIQRELTPEDGRMFVGHTWKGIFKVLADKYLRCMTPEEIRENFIRAKTEYFKYRTAPIANGLSDVIRLDIKKAIVTGSCRAEVDMFASSIDLDRFDLIASDELYEKGKPEPDAYLFAADYLGVKPSECLAVEDSRIGLTSAGNAGCVTVFSKEFADDDHSSIADYTVPGLRDILTLL